MSGADDSSGLLRCFRPEEVTALEAAFDCAIPEDDWPGGWHGGGRRLLVEHSDDFLRPAVAMLQQALAVLDRGARSLFGVDAFADLDPAARARVFASSLAEDDVSALLALTHQAFYGPGRDARLDARRGAAGRRGVSREPVTVIG